MVKLTRVFPTAPELGKSCNDKAKKTTGAEQLEVPLRYDKGDFPTEAVINPPKIRKAGHPVCPLQGFTLPLIFGKFTWFEPLLLDLRNLNHTFSQKKVQFSYL
jgi:hypothetical protein